MMYPAHSSLVEPARARPELWRLLAGLVLTAVIYALGIVAIFGLVALWSGLDGARAWRVELAGQAGPTGTLLLLATFAGMALGPMAAARLLHRRPALSLLGPLPLMVRQFGLTVLICIAVYAAMALIPSPGATLLPNTDPLIWASFLPLALVGVLVQTGAEEILFRGYLQSQLAARFASPLAWMVLPSAIFAVLHYQPDLMGANAWLVVGAIFVFSILAADLTAATGTIGAAWALHFVNNALAILLVSTEGPLSGLALYVTSISPDDPSIRPLLYLDIASTVALWAVVRLVLRWRATR